MSLGAIACPSAGNCSAVGEYLDGKGRFQGLLLSQRSGTWSRGVMAGLSPGAGNPELTQLTSVSCASAANCEAVGNYGSSGLLLDETFGIWHRGTGPTLPDDAAQPGSTTLGSVSCGRSGVCAAVGSYQSGLRQQQGFLLMGRAGAWHQGRAVVPLDGAQGTGSVNLTSVSCPAEGRCGLVGDFGDPSGDQQGLALGPVPNGQLTAPEVALPDRGGPWGVVLQDVSCGGTGSCVAVGGFGNPEGATLPTLATLSEGEWIVEQAPLPAGALPGSEATLGTVSCPSPGNCSALGSYTGPGDQQETFTLDQSSGSWGAPTEVTMANGQGAAGLSLTSMSCPSAGNCAAVGYYSRPGALFVHAYVVDETGGVWGPLQEVTVPGNASDSRLGAVSCASAGNCGAVGYATTGSATEPLAVDETAGEGVRPWSWPSRLAPAPCPWRSWARSRAVHRATARRWVTTRTTSTPERLWRPPTRLVTGCPRQRSSSRPAPRPLRARWSSSRSGAARLATALQSGTSSHPQKLAVREFSAPRRSQAPGTKAKRWPWPPVGTALWPT